VGMVMVTPVQCFFRLFDQPWVGGRSIILPAVHFSTAQPQLLPFVHDTRSSTLHAAHAHVHSFNFQLSIGHRVKILRLACDLCHLCMASCELGRQDPHNYIISCTRPVSLRYGYLGCRLHAQKGASESNQAAAWQQGSMASSVRAQDREFRLLKLKATTSWLGCVRVAS
jgi:hypothetical protein